MLVVETRKDALMEAIFLVGKKKLSIQINLSQVAYNTYNIVMSNILAMSPLSFIIEAKEEWIDE